MVRTVTVKWAVSQHLVRGSLIGTYATQEEAQAVADSQELPHKVTKWTINEYTNEKG